MCWPTRRRTSARSDPRDAHSPPSGARRPRRQAAVPDACRDHHGRQRPLGRGAASAEDRRPSRGRPRGPAHHRGGDRERRRLADDLRVQQRELASAGGRGARSDRPAAPIPEERARRTAERMACGCASSATGRASIPTSSTTLPRRKRDDVDQHQAQPDGRAVLWRAGGDRAPPREGWPRRCATGTLDPAQIDEDRVAGALGHRGDARSRPDHPHLGRAAAVQFPALARRLRRTGVPRRSVAGLRRRATSRRRWPNTPGGSGALVPALAERPPGAGRTCATACSRRWYWRPSRLPVSG